MRIAEYLRIVSTAHQRTPGWRLGQSYFNVLTEANPKLAEQVRGSSFDPFYSDDCIGEFLGFLSDHWHEATS